MFTFPVEHITMFTLTPGVKRELEEDEVMAMKNQGMNKWE